MMRERLLWGWGREEDSGYCFLRLKSLTRRQTWVEYVVGSYVIPGFPGFSGFPRSLSANRIFQNSNSILILDVIFAA